MPKDTVPESERIITKHEESPDGTLLLKFTIPGRPATKKTHQTAVFRKGKTIVLPSKQFAAYEKVCKPFCENAWKAKGEIPMDFGISIIARVYLNDWRIGDHVGYLQAIGDIIEKFGVISNDKFIHWGEDGSHWFGGVDKEYPRVEIEIRRFRHPYETFRAKKK